MTVILTRAKPYAKAIFDLALNQKKLTEYFRLLKRLSDFTIQIKKNLKIDDPKITHEQKEKLFSDFMGQIKEVDSLIKLLVKRKNLNLLPKIASSYKEIFFAYNKILNVKIVSAKKLSASQKKRFLETFKDRYKSKILLQCAVDTSLISGAVIYIGDKVIDASIKGTLLRLRKNLILNNTYDKT